MFPVKTARVVLAIACALVCLVSSASALERGPVGIDALDRLDMMPYLWTGRESKHVSSHDPTGGNDDRGHYLSTSTVIFDAKGPGCIYRIWTTNQYSASNYTPTAHGNIRIFIDDSTTPALDVPMSSFFSGSWSIFQTPLAGGTGVSSGGFYSYVPIPYRKSCKIWWIVDPTSVPGLYFNIDYTSYDSADGITSFTGQEQNDPAYMAKLNSVKTRWTNYGTDPKPAATTRSTTGNVSLPANSKMVMCDITGPGSISGIKIKKSAAGNMTDDEWKKIYVRIYFDNHTTPDVQTTLARFFGGDIHRPYPSDYREGYETLDGNIKGLLFGTNGSTGWNYNFFPMPFGKKAIIELESTLSNSFGLSYDVSIADMPEAERLLASGQIGFFKSTQTLGSVSSILGQDYQLMNVNGRGSVVGIVYTPYSNGTSKGYLEGDERIHVDDSQTPAIYGTGTEDIFNAGWYFKQGRFTLPTHGYTAEEPSSTDGRAMYKLYIGDSITYSSKLKFGVECGATNDIQGAKMYSTVYYYNTDPVLQLTDTLDIAKTDSETLHGYTVSAVSRMGPFFQNTKYEGDNDNVVVVPAEDGRHFGGGYSQFNLQIHPGNYGVKLRRMSYYVMNQSADVYVDGQLVGTWYDAGWNSTLMWRDSEFVIPASFTQGKSSITVKLVSSGQWTEYKYQALVFVSPQMPPPSPIISGDAVFNASSGSAHFSWTKPSEPVWGIMSYAYAIGTTSNGTDVKNWTDVGNVLSTDVTGLDLEEGKTYFISVKAKNGAGIWSVPGVTGGIIAPHSSASTVKVLPDGSSVIITGMTVSAVFKDSFYVEDADRTQAIRVKSTIPVMEGDVVYIEGKLSTVAGERQIDATKVTRK